jgi:hypothetical protein
VVIKLDPLTYLGYDVKLEPLHGAQQYDEAIATFDIMLSKMSDAPDTGRYDRCKSTGLYRLPTREERRSRATPTGVPSLQEDRRRHAKIGLFHLRQLVFAKFDLKVHIDEG